MAYKNNLKGYIEPEKTNDDKKLPSKVFDGQRRYYFLSHRKNDPRNKFQKFMGIDGEFKPDPQEMTLKEIRSYVNEHYIQASDINIYELINDLNIFKSYREEIKIENEIKGIFRDVVSLIMTIIAIFIAVAVGFLSVDESTLLRFDYDVGKFYGANFKFVYEMRGLLFKSIVVFPLFLYFIDIVNKKSGFNKLKTLNYTILTLESIRDDIYNNPIEIPETREFEVKVDNVVGQISEPRKYFVKVKESLEDKSN